MAPERRWRVHGRGYSPANALHQLALQAHPAQIYVVLVCNRDEFIRKEELGHTRTSRCKPKTLQPVRHMPVFLDPVGEGLGV